MLRDYYGITILTMDVGTHPNTYQASDINGYSHKRKSVYEDVGFVFLMLTLGDIPENPIPGICDPNRVKTRLRSIQP